MRAMIVDDQAELRFLAAAFLRQLCYETIEFSNPLPALSHLEQDCRFDVIITDIAMPFMNGLEFIGLLKLHYPTIPVIVMSSSADDQTIELARAEGALYDVRLLHSRDTFCEALRAVQAISS
jgi:CheY-like chemotaxis protein